LGSHVYAPSAFGITAGLPDFLSHYYEAQIGPFVNLSDLPLSEGESRLEQIRRSGQTFASRRSADYLIIRRDLEERVRASFIQKGGQPKRERPHYMILGACPWVLNWYQDGKELRLPLEKFPSKIVSFTYGDTFPAMRYDDDKPYRGRVYRLEELPALVQQFGLPQTWNPDGNLGPDRYIEAQIWDETPLKECLNRN
jgi:hypothetical protein